MFVKGKSGNPSGRPKVVGEVQELARKQGPQAIETLTKIMKNGRTKAVTRMAAACALLDRGYGRPMQSVMQMHAPLTELTNDELNDFIRRAREMEASTAPSGSGTATSTRH